MPSMETMNADLSQVGGAKKPSNLKHQRTASASKSVKFDKNAVPAVSEEESKGGAAAAANKKRPRSAVKGKAGKMLPKGPSAVGATRKGKNGVVQEEEPRRRGAPKVVEEEEVKLSPEEIY